MRIAAVGLALAVCTLTACSDAGEARLNRGVDAAIDSAGNKLERLGDRIDSKVRNAVADARAPKDAVDTANQANDAAFKNNRDRRDDARWATRTTADGLLHAEAGRLAATNASSGAVKTLATALINDHTEANNSLHGLAASRNIALPSGLSASGQDKVIELTQKTGADFDRAYLDFVVGDLRDESNSYAEQAKNGHDLELRQFAAKRVPVLQQHLQAAERARQAANAAK